MSESPSPQRVPQLLARPELLPKLPPVATDVLRLTAEPEVDLDELASLLGGAPSLAQKLVRFANSPLFSCGNSVTSIERAIDLLGVKRVQYMTLAFALVEKLAGQEGAPSFDRAEYWRRALARAVAGRAMASTAGTLGEDEAFLCGLLAEVGQLILSQTMSGAYEDVCRSAHGAWPSAELEEQLLGFDNQHVHEALLRSWNLPEPIERSVLGVLHDEDSDESADLRSLRNVLHLARLTVDVFGANRKGEALTAVEEKAAEYFSLPPDSVYAFISQLEADMREAGSLLGLEGAPPPEEPPPVTRQTRSGRSGFPHRRRIAADSALLDEMTGLPGRHAFEQFLHQEIAIRLEGRVKRPLGLMLVGINDFALLHRWLGQDATADVLRSVATAMQRRVRRGDLIARLGGSYFGVILSEANPVALRSLSARLQTAVHETQSEDADGPMLSIAIGGACLASARSPHDGKNLMRTSLLHLKRARKRALGVDLHPSVLLY